MAGTNLLSWAAGLPVAADRAFERRSTLLPPSFPCGTFSRDSLRGMKQRPRGWT